MAMERERDKRKVELRDNEKDMRRQKKSSFRLEIKSQGSGGWPEYWWLG